MNKQYLFIANWKMNMSFNETVEFATSNYDAFVELATTTNQKIILCPTTESVYPLAQMFKNTPVTIGAQTCSRHTHGAFTGQVPPQNLHEIGCSHCIIGHSETRKEYNESNEAIVQKCVHLLDYDITPIMCIGETKAEHAAGKTLEMLSTQLAPLFDTLASKTTVHSYLTPCIAYEPIWSIGTGDLAPIDHLDMVFSWLGEQLHQKLPKIPFKLIYGGSVFDQNCAELKKIDKIDGFLLGRASLDFKKLEKIV